MQNISLLYDFEIERITQEKSLSLLPLVYHVLLGWPDADWADVSYTISEHVKEQGLNGLPQELLTNPEVKNVTVDLPPQSDSEDDMPDIDLFNQDLDNYDSELELENINVLIRPKRVERLVDVREILQQVRHGKL